MVKRVLWEKPKDGVCWPDMNFGEVLVLVPLFALTLVIGFYPDVILQFQKQAVDMLVKIL